MDVCLLSQRNDIVILSYRSTSICPITRQHLLFPPSCSRSPITFRRLPFLSDIGGRYGLSMFQPIDNYEWLRLVLSAGERVVRVCRSSKPHIQPSLPFWLKRVSVPFRSLDFYDSYKHSLTLAISFLPSAILSETKGIPILAASVLIISLWFSLPFHQLSTPQNRKPLTHVWLGLSNGINSQRTILSTWQSTR